VLIDGEMKQQAVALRSRCGWAEGGTCPRWTGRGSESTPVMLFFEARGGWGRATLVAVLLGFYTLHLCDERSGMAFKYCKGAHIR